MKKLRTILFYVIKTHKGYKEKVAVENAWNEVSKKLEFIENGRNFGLEIMFCKIWCSPKSCGYKFPVL